MLQLTTYKHKIRGFLFSWNSIILYLHPLIHKTRILYRIFTSQFNYTFSSSNIVTSLYHDFKIKLDIGNSNFYLNVALGLQLVILESEIG